MAITHYNKLVRGKIPDIIRASGGTPVFHLADAAEYVRELEKKLGEEVGEYLAESGARDPEELADVVEVIHALAAVHGLSPAALEAVRKKKVDERGDLSQPIILDSVEK